MKKTFLMLFAGALLAGFTFTACEKDNGNNTGGNGGAIVDDDDDEGGEVSLHPSLQGSDYYVLFMDDDSYASIEDKVVADFRPAVDAEGNTVVNIDVWSGTYTAGTNSNVGFYGAATGWVSFVVGNGGWSGGAWDLYNGVVDVPNVDKVTAIADDLESYYLHFAYKTAQEGKSHLMYMTWPSADTAGKSHAFGDPSVPYDDNGIQYTPILPVSGEFVVGEWNEYEIPLADMGLDFSQEPLKAAINLFAFLSGGVAGTTLDLDAVFIYRK